jgi:hypothetical protein
LFVIVACLYIAIVSILLIKIIFKGALEKVIYDFNKKAYLLKRNIGVNLYVDKTFIDMLYNDNFDSIKDQIKNKINGNMQAASKMIFTYNVYKHYTTNFTLSSPYMQDFKNAFTFENLKGIQQSGKFEPVEFLKYSDSIESVTFDDHFMMDMTSDVESTEDALSSDLLNAYTRNKINGIILRDDVSNKLNSVSNVAQNFTKTNLEKIYKIIFKFVLSMFIFACINLAIIVGCFFIYKTMSKIQSGKQLVSNNL